MASKHGINLDWLNAGASPTPDEVAGMGWVSWVRLIARPLHKPHPVRHGETLAGYTESLRAVGIRSIVVLPHESFSSDEAIVPETMEYATHLHPDVFQIGNEPDSEWNPGFSAERNSAASRQTRSEASWCMEPHDYANLVFNCADAIRRSGNGARIISAGFTSGFASWMPPDVWGAIMDHLDGVAVHPYLKRPAVDWPADGVVSGEPRGFVGALLDEYTAAAGKPLWVTEFGTVDPPLHEEYYARMFRTLEDRSDVEAACAFCFSDAMHQGGYALLNTPAMARIGEGAPVHA